MRTAKAYIELFPVVRNRGKVNGHPSRPNRFSGSGGIDHAELSDISILRRQKDSVSNGLVRVIIDGSKSLTVEVNFPEHNFSPLPDLDNSNLLISVDANNLVVEVA